MTLKGQVSGEGWSVSVDTVTIADGFSCDVQVEHGGASGEFKHRFRHWQTFKSEREAVLDGLREGMVWLALKQAQTIHL
ncbi:UDP-glucose 4-epimerase [Caballeronia sp. DA-9]|uniref:UDP-glucose 4-epimerase n=1 Tax=Caballeronia sp. DA-9 TaxID=3436237 RepID=UPI003F681E4E